MSMFLEVFSSLQRRNVLVRVENGMGLYVNVLLSAFFRVGVPISFFLSIAIY